MINTLPKSLVEAASNLIDNENFKQWAGKSKLKHKDGSPMKFYHGTDKDFDAFSYKHVGKGTDAHGSGFYFTNKPEVASSYASSKGNEGQHVLPVHLRLENPIEAETDDETPFKRDHIKKLIMNAPDHKDSLGNYGDIDYHGYHKVLNDAVDSYTELPKINAFHALANDFYRGHDAEYLQNVKKHTGHDGVIVKNGDHMIVNVFHPNQIKSSVGNNGNYSKEKDTITEKFNKPLNVTHASREGWLHVENQKNQTPLDHVREIVGNHKELGWSVDDNEGVLLHHKLMMNRGGMGCMRSIQMKHNDGRKMVLHMKFKNGNEVKQKEYMVDREFRTIH